jgi:glutathione synthase/RimK-type ligase-like ATP-grasp enzyme
MPARLALVTYPGAPGLHEDDQVALPALKAHGFSPEPVSWDADVDWLAFDRIVVRNTWDYFQRYDEFRAWLDRLEALGAPVLNPVPTLRQNSDKRYLWELAERGIPTVETHWVERGGRVDLAGLMASYGWEEAVVKPTVSGGGWRTHRVRRQDAEAFQETLEREAQLSALMVQPFVREFIEQGEHSLVYFNRFLSHAMQKRPAEGNFLVQLEHGGSIREIQPPAELRDLAERSLAEFPGTLLYARVDAVHTQGTWRVNEVELIEPMLYLRFSEGAGERFAAALAAHWADLPLAASREAKSPDLRTPAV